MIDELINWVFKKNKFIGIIIGGIALVAYVLDTINNLFLVKNFSFNSPWLFVFLLFIGIVTFFIGSNKSGEYSYSQRKLARASFVLTAQLLIYSFAIQLHLSNQIISWLIFIYTVCSISIYILVNHHDKNSTSFVVLFCEFSDSASEDIPKDRHITYYVRKEIKKEFHDNAITIIDVDKVILDEEEAYKIGVNAGATAVIYGIVTKLQKNIKLDLRFSVIRIPHYYQPIDIKQRILPIEELDSGQLESFIGKDYTIAIDFLLGLFEYSRKNYEQAKSKFLSVIEGIVAQSAYDYSINTESVNLYLGNSHYLSGDIDEAKKVFENALKAAPNSSKIIHNLGIVEFQLSNHVRSVELFSKAISIAPELIVVHRNRGYALIQSGEYEKALDDLIKYVSQKPFDADTLRLIGLCYSNLDNAQNAIKYYKAYYKLSKDKDIIFDIANEYFSEQRYWSCFFTLLANFVRPKQYSRSLGIIADYLEKINHISFAEFIYSIAILLDKNNAYLYFSRAHARTLKKRKKEATDDFLKAISIESKLADAYYNLGNLYMSDKNYELAIEKYSDFLKLMPDSLDGLFNRAQGYYFLQQYELSINDAQNYIVLTGDPDGKGHAIVGHNYLKKGMRNEGINFLIAAYNRQPSEQLKNTIEQLKRI